MLFGIITIIIVLALLAGVVAMGMREDRNNKGFSMVELLVVIAIIGLISSLAWVFFGGSTIKARDTKRLSDLNQIGRFLSFGCPLPAGGPGTYDLNDLIAEFKTTYPEHADKVPSGIRDPKSGSEAVANYSYLVDGSNNCALFANLEDSDREITLPGINAPTPRGGKGVYEGLVNGVNGTNKFFQVSN